MCVYICAIALENPHLVSGFATLCHVDPPVGLAGSTGQRPMASSRLKPVVCGRWLAEGPHDISWIFIVDYCGNSDG